MMVPVASIVLIWNVIFHYNGALNSLLVRFGIVKIDWMKSELNQLVVVLLFLWKNLGYNMILFMAALNNIPKGLLEVAEIEERAAYTSFQDKAALPFAHNTVCYHPVHDKFL